MGETVSSIAMAGTHVYLLALLLVVGTGECWLVQTGAGLRLAGLRAFQGTCRGGKWERIEGGGEREGRSSSAWDLAMHAEPQGAGKVRGGGRPLVNAAMICGRISSAAAALLSLSAMAAAEGGVYSAAVEQAAGGVDQVFILLLRLLPASYTSQSTSAFCPRLLPLHLALSP
jgi:hypothetical protein